MVENAFSVGVIEAYITKLKEMANLGYKRKKGHVSLYKFICLYCNDDVFSSFFSVWVVTALGGVGGIWLGDRNGCVKGEGGRS
jgi:hypothetical protein